MLKWDDSITNESLKIYEALEAFYTHKVLFIIGTNILTVSHNSKTTVAAAFN
jgi:hypothetical protein